MSDNTSEGPHHTGPIRTAKQFFWVSVGAFVVPMFVIIGIVFWITSGNDGSPGETDSAAKLQARIAPVATFKVGQAGASEAQPGATPVAAAAPAAAGGGDPVAIAKKLYESTCIACHGTGAAGAPKFGDKAAWAPRIALGEDKLVAAAIHGIGAMPPRGGSQATDAEMRDTVVYIANAAGANFPEPKAAPAAAAPAAAPAAAQPAAASGAINLAAGKKLYESTCIACHGTGAAGAPKFGDKAAWAPRIALGEDKLVAAAIHGIGAMPPRGGSQATDAEMRDAVVYMTDASGANFATGAKSGGAAPAATPAAKPATAAPAAAPAAAAGAAAAQKIDLAEGKKLYESTCIACHGTGAAGAPKFGNQADWAPRIKLGLDKLVDVAIHGLGAMPPRGGSQATDAQLRDAVVYMTDHSGAHFAEGK